MYAYSVLKADESEGAVVGKKGVMPKPVNPAASAPAQLDKSSSIGVPEHQANGTDTGSPPTTHPDTVDYVSFEEKAVVHDKQQSNDTTDRTSQATSATTNKMPLSPNTPGTSVMSRDSEENRGMSNAVDLSNSHSPVTKSTQEVDDTNYTNKSSFGGLRKKASS